MDVVGRYVAILLAVILITLFPLQYFAIAEYEMIDNAVNAIAADFTDTARHQGCITRDSYEDFMKKLDHTGAYDITIEVAHPVTGKEVSEASFRNVRNDILKINTMQTSSKNVAEVQLLSAHLHTDDCYNGVKHVHTGNSTSGGGCYGTYNSGSACNLPIYYDRQSAGQLSFPCSACGIGTCKGYYIDDIYLCGKQHITSVTVSFYWVCQNCGVNFRLGQGSVPTACRNTIAGYYSLNCGKTAGLYYNGNTLVQPICDQVVTSITPMNSSQTVKMGEMIDTTVTANFLDGHSGIVTCASNFNPSILGNQIVTLTYSGLVGNAKTTGATTCTVNITVEELKHLTGITITPTEQSVRRYVQPPFTVRAFYDDESSDIVAGYILSGFDASRLGIQNVTVLYTENSITTSADAMLSVRNMVKTCPICGSEYELDENDQDNGCPVCNSTLTGIIATPEYMTVSIGDSLPIMVEATYLSGGRVTVIEWISDYNPNLLGYQEVTITYQDMQTFISVYVKDNKKTCPECGEEYLLNEDGFDPGCPSCKLFVVSIHASPDQITIQKLQPLPITVIATFRDGHTEEVTDWSTDLSAGATGTFDVTVYYKTVKDYITVTVLGDDIIQCPYCSLSYSFYEHPEGCPVCYYTLTGIEASLRDGGTTVLRNSQPNIELTLIFQDTHMQLVYSGWTVEGYHPDLLGVQTIKVIYQGFSSLLTIEVIEGPKKKTCPNGHEYYLNDDGSDPGCPYCLFEKEKDNAILYFDITYTNEILESICRDGKYTLKNGDYLTITVTPRHSSFRAILSKISFGINSDIKRTYTFGGEVI